MKVFQLNTESPNNNKICSVKNINKHEFIGVWVTDKPESKRSRCLFQPQMSKKWWETDELGRYCNHSFIPNTNVISYSDKLILKASRHINNSEEILVDYTEITRLTRYIPNMDF